MEDATTPSDDELLNGWKSRLGPLTVSEKIEQADLLKRQGNLLVKDGDFKRALTSYAKVFAYVNGLSVQGDAMSQYAQGSTDMSATADQGQEIQVLKAAVWSNMALCHLKIQTQPEKALSCCDKVLELEPTHSKARFRKAQALEQLSHFERAYKLLAELLEEEPKNAAREKEKNAFGNMFK
ncbi:hypothetical protein BBO99_00005599 [Phytophthora kernoviae]|uniref:peptidylprolyl isomerase n=2 Tax=Phytophthora kernoviae TaxID=325452 RepID=A0A421FDS4_9STRA|nr:hypothetical protein G195_006467 [Phytophthora kernoviae 00238/432]KAG2523000.1 hypothetical protein JM16_005563 [Phytophthora kernoviae]KAG2524691.1 hypothetical protein JM18_005296 [Phytophthora kernoviae]RLN38225.1 hypothetical protein BBI17_005939 [Phytophthora kernoviae]RLN78935.1 hypothetical protein BBO99_00005599 [Phytophthora kernoviae]